MNNVQNCKPHDLPIDWCGPCSAALKERERIIALLERIDIYPTGWNYDDPIESVIALIKGEN